MVTPALADRLATYLDVTLCMWTQVWLEVPLSMQVVCVRYVCVCACGLKCGQECPWACSVLCACELKRG